ncbi:FadR/GntR family transcriptional regulator [Nakamurella leprariae]|uniref:FadR family transcriptional regulator n=1 Tax=Nakamurella leprariae TaxID=2803911 RepID=A0A939BWH2_9ACTN|nr:FCD domain-containing protein [Nakamurella leprariae]MBM9467543.1 FadR family transcriptional regulator [Nakamurella leprariae]
MRASDVVLRHLEAQLEDGTLVVGMRLPGERTLAEQLGVSRGSVREALQVLEAMGVLRRAVGSGQDAGAVLVAEPSAPLDSALRLHVATRAFDVQQVVETRMLLESWAVGRAATTGGSLDAARALLADMDDPDLDVRDFLRLDARFHVELAALSGNALVALIMTSIRGSIEAYVQRSVPRVTDWPDLLAKLRREHHAVLDAVAAGDVAGASATVVRHIAEFYERSGLQQPESRGGG